MTGTTPMRALLGTGLSVTLCAVLVSLTACTSPATDSTSMPVPDPSASASGAVSAGDDEATPEDPIGWLIEGQTTFVTASARICADDDLLFENSEFPSILLEANGGPPDDWDGVSTYEIDDSNITLHFGEGQWYANRFDGANGKGDSWQTPNGTLTVMRDSNGVVTGGSGTGRGEVIYANGDGGRFDDTVTFTVTVMEQPAWCTIPVD
ncbi:hypothetical protein [Microcella sp.]|uniref:hypothetical protein n=1 Tax=Microcella sp. TaxID=1913979 RepID=UPI00299F8536|nr:hypothetical protein [Microcella sp.]MDX2025383.1 hypothetical protein [Microcella sp.]